MTRKLGLLLVIGLVTALAGLPASGHARPKERVIGGAVAAPGQAPWVAALVVRGRDALASQTCGAAVVAPRAVVTAAHCVADAPAGALDVVTGRARLSDPGGERLAVGQVRVHPSFDDRTAANDLAVLRLAAATTAPAIALPGAAEAAPLTAAGATATLYGWGGVENVENSVSDELRFGAMRVVSAASCRERWNPLFAAPLQLCAVGPDRGRPDACAGDSGGPLVGGPTEAPRLLGIASYGGQRCGDPASPTVFTRVPGFARWIAGQAGIAPPPGSTDLSGVALAFSKIRCSPRCFVDVLATGDGAEELPAVDVRVRGPESDRVFRTQRLRARRWRADVGFAPPGRLRIVATALDESGRPVGLRAKTTVTMAPG